MKNKTAKIGIGITTHNRYDVFSKTLKEIRKYAPIPCEIVIVDDASKKPVPEATYRFDKNVGIATAKNKCLELLEHCEHIFLFDDDCYPIAKDWHKPYIESGEPHLMYIFVHMKNLKLRDTEILYTDDKIIGYSHARGCMLYLHNSILKAVGGMDITYCRWGFEHGDLSNRIYNAGLTTFRFGDVVGSNKLIFSGDEERSVKTTVPYEERAEYIKSSEKKYRASFESSAFKPYKNYEKKSGRSVVITTYLNSMPDVQRNNNIWEAEYSALNDLIASANKNKTELVVLHNCFNEKDTKYVKHLFVEQGLNPYFQRWLSIWQYLRDNPDIDKVFCVDATDVEILRNPFDDVYPGILYIGDEPQILGCPWIKMITVSQDMKNYFLENRTEQLYNCGVIGGSREMVMKICRDMYEIFIKTDNRETIDMPVFNYLIHTKYKNSIESGRKITSVFKAYEDSSLAWFKHK